MGSKKEMYRGEIFGQENYTTPEAFCGISVNLNPQTGTIECVLFNRSYMLPRQNVQHVKKYTFNCSIFGNSF